MVATVTGLSAALVGLAFDIAPLLIAGVVIAAGGRTVAGIFLRTRAGTGRLVGDGVSAR
jgi:hypothetical protein